MANNLSVGEILNSLKDMMGTRANRPVIQNSEDPEKEKILELTEIVGGNDGSQITDNVLPNKGLISVKVTAETSDKFKELANKAKSNRTVEELVIDIMRPYLSQWLDKNLPRLVHKIVEKEVRKLVPEDE